MRCVNAGPDPGVRTGVTYKTDTTLATDGFDALSALDTNLDGDISSADTRFADLRLWRDLNQDGINQDGINQSGELFTLAGQNIASIHLGKTANSVVLANGNQIADLGGYTRTDGSESLMGETSTLGDINLIQDNFNTSFSTHPDTTTVAHLADMQGSGQVRDLREAAALSPTLAAKLGEYATAFVILEWGIAALDRVTPELMGRNNRDASNDRLWERCA